MAFVASDMMALLDINKELPRFNVSLPSSRKNVPSSTASSMQDLMSLDTELKSGTDYVEQYVLEEHQKILESAAPCTSDDKFDTVSVGTSVPSEFTDITTEDLNKLYSTYDFTYQPKGKLAINSKREQIVSMIETNSVVVLQGPTGCGKTTQVPQYILDDSCQKRKHCNIIVTQPRRIAAVSIATRVSQERYWPLGTLVGYRIGMLNCCNQDTRLTYCTTGVLLRKLIKDKNMLDFTHVILDEVHERDQEMDFLLLVVRKLLFANSRSVKVILMSATFNAEKFSKYFAVPIGGKNMVPVPIIDIVKRNAFEISKFYLNELKNIGEMPDFLFSNPRISNGLIDLCMKLIHIFNDFDNDETYGVHRHVVLIFLPGIWEIEEMRNALINCSKKDVMKDPKWDIVVLHSTVTNEEQQKIFQNPPEGYRRIILSTNIAESSLTVPDVKYVIDFCLTKVLVTDPTTNFQCLELGWASKANCEQRAGRTGRVMEGRVYRLVPKHYYDNHFLDEGAPEIKRAPLEHLILNAKILDMGEPCALLALALDPPNLDNVQRTILLLKEAGALLNKADEIQPLDGELTDLGRMMANLPVNINIAKFIALGHAFGILKSAIIIGASMSLKNMFSTPFQQKMQAYSAKLKWANGSCSDCIAFLYVYQMWVSEKLNRNFHDKQAEKNWAKNHYIQLRVLYEVQALMAELTSRLKAYGITIPLGVDNKDDSLDPDHGFILKVVIAGAFYPNYFVNNFPGVTKNDGEVVKKVCGLDPMRSVYLTGWPLRQNGLLYAKRFQDIFKNCTGMKFANKIRVRFDGSSRVYIDFGTSPSFVKPNFIKDVMEPQEFTIPGTISMAVYRALRMRIDNPHIPIQISDEITAQRMTEQLQLDSKTCLDIMGNEETAVGKGGREMTKIRPILPAIDSECVQLVIQHIVNPGRFWAIIKTPHADEWMYRIYNKVNDLKLLMQLDHRPIVGERVIAPYWKPNETGPPTLYRAVVQNLRFCSNERDNKVSLYYVDSGFSQDLKMSDLRQFKSADDSVMDIPDLAIECVLAHVKPASSRTIDGTWSSSAREEFVKLIGGDKNNLKIFGEIYSVVNSVIFIVLFSQGQSEKKVNINESLIASGFADLKEENYLSRANHEIRQKLANHTLLLNDEQKKGIENEQYDQDSQIFAYPNPPPFEQCRSVVKLCGPHSPLEIELLPLVKAGSGKRVNVDRSSVNSVLLDTDPADTSDRLVVASIVSQNLTGANLTIRNTTLMPNIPGLTELLCAIFCPTMELRLNPMRSHYSGALFGLGGHPLKKESLFPEHDIEFPFGVEITNDDLLEINKMRHWMNMALQIHEGGEDDKEMIKCQENVRQCLWKVFDKKREKKIVELYNYGGRWKTYVPSLLLYPGKVRMIKNNIYPLHCAMDIKPNDQKLLKMIMHIQELRNIAIEDSRKHCQEIVCELCEEEVYGASALRVHLWSPNHRAKENMLELSPNL